MKFFDDNIFKFKINSIDWIHQEKNETDPVLKDLIKDKEYLAYME